MQVKKSVIHATLVAALVFVPGIFVVARADGHPPPPPANVDQAKAVADLLENEMFAALLQEFGETTAANAAQGKMAISLIFNDANPAIRLVGDESPVDPGNVPRDGFERTALADALDDGTPYEAVEQSQDGNNGWYYRRSIPLSNDFSTACVLCHDNFASLTNPWVGTLTLKVPIPN
jgi:hypothetical protein